MKALRAALLALSLCAPAAWAQAWPSKPIRWVVPSTPGDGSDVTGGVLGSEFVAKSPADGYTMIVGNAGSHGINAAIYTKLTYDVVKDFVPVALICAAPNVMVVSPGTKVSNVAEFVAYAKANAGKVNYASGGIGSSSHLSGELFKSLAGVDMTHIPYKGASPAVTAVLADEVNIVIGNLPPWSAHIKAGTVRAIAVTTARRHASLPKVPALAEALPGFETVAWFGVLAPAGTPKVVVERVNVAINRALELADAKARLATLGCDPARTTPEAFAGRVNGDVARWKKLAAEKQIRAD